MRDIPEPGGLVDPSEPDRLFPYIRSLWQRRSYAFYVAGSELRDRQITSTLGNLWYLLNPGLQILVYFIVFGVVIPGVRAGTDNYIMFVTVGILLFTTTQRSMVTGSQSIVRNRGLIQSFSFPRALLPLTSSLTEFLASLPGVLVMMFVAIATGEEITLAWFALVPVLLSLFVLNLGLAFLAARITTYFRDFDQILPFMLRLLLYMSGVLFSVEAMMEGRSFRWVFEANPIHAHIALARWALMGGELSLTWIACSAAWGLSLLVVGLVWFHTGEKHYGNI